MKDLIPVRDAEVVLDQAALVPIDANAEKIKSLQNLIMSIYNRNNEIRAIFAYNHDRGYPMVEMGPHEAPMDYKLNQLDGDVRELMGRFGLLENECSTQIKNSPRGGQKRLR